MGDVYSLFFQTTANQGKEPNTTQTEHTWTQQLWLLCTNIFTTLWDYRLTIFRDVMILVLAAMIIYMFWTIIRNQREPAMMSAKAAATVTAPTTYNHSTNIHVWLNELNDYLDQKKIINETEKQEIVLERLDKTSKNTIKRLIDEKRIKTYNDLETHLKNYFSSSNVWSTDNLLQFITRKQQPYESLAQFYETMQNLAKQAYPKTPKETIDSFTNEYFIKGFHSIPLKQQLLLTNTENKSDVLANA